MLEDGIEQRDDIVGRFFPVVRHPTLLGGTIDSGKVELILGGVETEHQVEHLLLHLLGAAVGLVHFVDYQYWLEPYLQGFLQYKASLWHGAFEGVDYQQAAVGHVEHAFDLPAEVGVTRGVDDVYFGVVVLY